MGDVIFLQQISSLIATLGVLAAATYYIFTLRANDRNRRIQLVSQLSRDVGTVDGVKYHFMLLNMEWDDYDDFERKYGSDTNLESAAIRYNSWNTYNDLGYMLRTGMVNREDIWSISGTGISVIYQWAKWGNIIKEQRKRYNGSNWMKDYEYLADEMLKIMLREDPSFKVPDTFAKYISDDE